MTVPCETRTAGTALLDHAQLVKVLGAVVAGETKKDAAQTIVTLTGDLLRGGSMTVPITALAPDSFTHPPLPAPTLATVDTPAFLAQLHRTLPARGTDFTLPILTGVEVTLAGQALTLAATDRYRFAAASIPSAPAQNGTAGDATLSAVVPGDALKRLAPALKTHTGPLSLGFTPDGRWLTLTSGQITTTLRSFEGRLPSYSKLFPTTAAASVSIPRIMLTTALKKTAAVIKAKAGKNTPVSLLWDGSGHLSLAPVLPDDQDRARLRGIPLPYTTLQGDPTVLHRRAASFNPSFLADTLAAFSSDTITLHIPAKITKNENLAVTFTDGPSITGDGYRHLLMSVRLEEGTWNL
ncbi:DNA polymerase III subunit beta family protein [Streptomyces filamentosus]